MKRRLLLGAFEREEDLLAMAETAQRKGLRIVDVYTPYPVHGLDRAMGLAPSRLTAVCLVAGLLGVILAVWGQFWTMSVDWPINVGGRPWNSLPAYVPVIFELMVLFAGFGVVFAFFGVSRLFPGKKALVPLAGVTDNRFVLILEEVDAAFDAKYLRGLFLAHHALHVEEREEEQLKAPTAKTRKSCLQRINVALGVALGIVVLLNWLVGRDRRVPNFEFLPDMAHSTRHNGLQNEFQVGDESVILEPVPGTIARGHKPLHYQATPDDALRAGRELRNPFRAKDEKRQEMGAQVYRNFCLICHGPDGKGDGPMTTRGVPPPPSLHRDETRKLKDGHLFHILTYGQKNMASYASQLSPEERWAAILYVRTLQQQSATKEKP